MSKHGNKIHMPDAAEDRQIAAGIAEDPDTFEPDEKWWQEAISRTRRGRPRSETPKVRVTIRLSRSVVDAFRAEGKGWQSRIDAELREVVDRKKSA